jgi:anti-sigma B factor antagonist
MALELESADLDGDCVIKAVGEVDLYSSPRLREVILKSIPAVQRAVGVDLSQVAYMDSSGVATLVEGLKASGKSDKAFVLLSPSPSVMKVLQLSRLDAVFTIKEALSSL